MSVRKQQTNLRVKNSTAEIGNKKLEYPVGLISADEIVTAGSGKYGTASDYYLKRTSWYWSVAPVINLTAEYTKTLVGDGTIDDFYRDPNA